MQKKSGDRRAAAQGKSAKYSEFTIADRPSALKAQHYWSSLSGKDRTAARLTAGETLWMDPDVPPYAVRVGLYMLHKRMNTDGQAWPKVATIAADLGTSERTAKRGLAWLLGNGFLIRTRRGRSRGKIGLSCYVIAPPHALSEGAISGTDKGTDVAHDKGTDVAPPIEPIQESNPSTESFGGDLLESLIAEFWEAYPKKSGVLLAEQAFKDAVKGGADPRMIIEEAAVYRGFCDLRDRAEEYVMEPRNWLRGKMYEESAEKRAKEVNERALKMVEKEPTDFDFPTNPRILEAPNGEALADLHRRIASRATREPGGWMFRYLMLGYAEYPEGAEWPSRLGFAPENDWKWDNLDGSRELCNFARRWRDMLGVRGSRDIEIVLCPRESIEKARSGHPGE